MSVRLSVRLEPVQLDPVAQTREHLRHSPAQVGAVASFLGILRSHSQCGQPLASMHLEHYPELTETTLATICRTQVAAHALKAIRVSHRIGHVAVGDPIVLVLCESAHRAAALAACHDMMEQLKTQVPLWKRETTLSGTHIWIAPEPHESALCPVAS